MAANSLIDVLLNLLRDDEALAAFQADPDSFLASCGITDLSPADAHESLVLLQDSHEASFDRDHHTGGNHTGGGHHPQLPPPPHPHPGDDSHEAAVKYLSTYVTNNYIDDRDTIVDNSVNQNIDNRGGHFDQDIDIDSVVASGDGAVAAGDDIRDSTIVTGDDNIVGNGNDVVQGDGNTVAFDGDATSTDVHDVSLDDGSALAVNGDASTADNDTTTTVGNFGDGDTAVNVAGANGGASQLSNQVEDNSTTDVTTNIASFNEDNDRIEDSFQSDDDVSILSNNDVASNNEDNDVIDDKDAVDITL